MSPSLELRRHRKSLREIYNISLVRQTDKVRNTRLATDAMRTRRRRLEYFKHYTNILPTLKYGKRIFGGIALYGGSSARALIHCLISIEKLYDHIKDGEREISE